MKDLYMNKFKQNVRIISIGEYYATDKEEGIATVLGSCISACVYEDGGGIGGMNHFLVPGDFRNEEIFLSPVARYGMFAMELLMGELIKLKVDRTRLRAKVFGGAQIISGQSNKVGKNNIRFIETFLEMEGIPIVSSDMGGKSARKIFFFPHNGKVLVKRITQNVNKIVGIEDQYQQKAKLEL
ncbi:MAG: chemoreceptor glutamine deamidase CheD [bacterium]|nr:chemoreceptor glutamine deamidase CheD [bacterium]